MTAERWTPDEDALLRANKPVPNRTAQACWMRAHKLGVPYTPKNPKCGIRIDEHTKVLIAEEVRKTRNTRATGRKFGVSYEAVRAVCAERHIAVQPCSRDLLGDYVEWGGAKWVWTGKGYWRETGGARRNLARTLWEHYHGESLPKGFCVFFRDGNRHNLKCDNLEAMTMSEFTRRRLTIDPLFRATMLAAGAIGRLAAEKAEMFDSLYSVYATLNGTKFADGLREKHRKVIAGNSKSLFAQAVKLEKELKEYGNEKD